MLGCSSDRLNMYTDAVDRVHYEVSRVLKYYGISYPKTHLYTRQDPLASSGRLQPEYHLNLVWSKGDLEEWPFVWECGHRHLMQRRSPELCSKTQGRQTIDECLLYLSWMRSRPCLTVLAADEGWVLIASIWSQMHTCLLPKLQILKIYETWWKMVVNQSKF